MSRLAAVIIGLALAVGVAVQGPTVPGTAGRYRLLGSDPRVSQIAVIGDSYTTGTNEGGLGPNSWTERAWQLLLQRGMRIDADVAAEAGAGYGMPGDHGGIFADLTAQAARSDDVLVLFFGSRNDEGVDPGTLSDRVGIAFGLARDLAPSARFLVIGPPWPTADVPADVLQIRDLLRLRAGVVGATFVDPIELGWFADRPDLIGADGVHPNDAGHAYMADKIAGLIEDQLS
ncbi:Rv0518 family GDSL lipase [Mycobacterium sp.]|uniref:Rv0518 family GDSL lipase n=1 Tax=Mycobacterium sp. TaxID=1785 RepID=UPI003A8C5987